MFSQTTRGDVLSLTCTVVVAKALSLLLRRRAVLCRRYDKGSATFDQTTLGVVPSLGQILCYYGPDDEIFRVVAVAKDPPRLLRRRGVLRRRCGNISPTFAQTTQGFVPSIWQIMFHVFSEGVRLCAVVAAKAGGEWQRSIPCAVYSSVCLI